MHVCTPLQLSTFIMGMIIKPAADEVMRMVRQTTWTSLNYFTQKIPTNLRTAVLLILY